MKQGKVFANLKVKVILSLLFMLICVTALAACGGEKQTSYVLTVPDKEIAVKLNDKEYDFLSDVSGTKDGEPAEVSVDASHVDVSTAGGEYYVTYTLGNKTATRTVKVYDTPVFIGENITIPYDGSVLDEIVAKDSYGEYLKVTALSNLATDSIGRVLYQQNEIEYTAVDAAGNSATYTRTVTVSQESRPSVLPLNVDLVDVTTSVDLPQGFNLESLYLKDGDAFTAISDNKYYIHNNKLRFSPDFLAEDIGVSQRIISLNFVEGYCDLSLTVTDDQELSYTLKNIDGEEFVVSSDVVLPNVTLSENSRQNFTPKYTLTKGGEKVEIPENFIGNIETGEYVYTVEIVRKNQQIAAVTMNFEVMTEQAYYTRTITGKKFEKYFSPFDANLDSYISPIAGNYVVWDETEEAFKLHNETDTGDNNRGFYFDKTYLNREKEVAGKTLLRFEWKSAPGAQLIGTFYNNERSNKEKWFGDYSASTDKNSWSTAYLEITDDDNDVLFFLGAAPGDYYIKNIEFVEFVRENVFAQKQNESVDSLEIQFNLSANEGNFFEDISIFYNAPDNTAKSAKNADRILLGGAIAGGSSSWVSVQLLKKNMTVKEGISYSGYHTIKSSAAGEKLAIWPFNGENWTKLFSGNSGTFIVQIFNVDENNDSTNDSAKMIVMVKNGDKLFPLFEMNGLPVVSEGYAGIYDRGNGTSAITLSDKRVSAALTNMDVKTFGGIYTGNAFEISFRLTKSISPIDIYIGSTSDALYDVYRAPLAISSTGSGSGHNVLLNVFGGSTLYNNLTFYNEKGVLRENGWSDIAPAWNELSGSASKDIRICFVNGENDTASLTMFINGKLYMHAENLPSFGTGGFAAVIANNTPFTQVDGISGFAIKDVSGAALVGETDKTIELELQQSTEINIFDFITLNNVKLGEVKISVSDDSFVDINSDMLNTIGRFTITGTEVTSVGKAATISVMAGNVVFRIYVSVVDAPRYSVYGDINGATFHTAETIALPVITPETDENFTMTYELYKDGEKYEISGELNEFVGSLEAGSYEYVVYITKGKVYERRFAFTVSADASVQTVWAAPYGEGQDHVDTVSIMFDVTGIQSTAFFAELEFFVNGENGSRVKVDEAMRVLFGGGIGSANWQASRVYNNGSGKSVTPTGYETIKCAVSGEQINIWIFGDQDNLKYLFPNGTGRLIGEFKNEGAGSVFTLWAQCERGYAKLFSMSGLSKIEPGYAGVYYKGTKHMTVSDVKVTTELTPVYSGQYTGDSFEISFELLQTIKNMNIYVGGQSNDLGGMMSSPFVTTTYHANGACYIYLENGYRFGGVFPFINKNGQSITNGWPGDTGWNVIGEGETAPKKIRIRFQNGENNKTVMTIYVNDVQYLKAENLPTIGANNYVGILLDDKEFCESDNITDFKITEVADVSA